MKSLSRLKHVIIVEVTSRLLQITYFQESKAVLIIRRYFKLVYDYSSKNDLLEKSLRELRKMKLPFRFDYWPVEFPYPDELQLIAEKRSKGKPGTFRIKSPIWVSFMDL